MTAKTKYTKPELLKWPMTASDTERPVCDISFLDESMTNREIYKVLEHLPWRRGAHQIVIDHGVRAYLLGLLRERLPRSARHVV
jgi:hypothetical protein